MEIDSPQPRRQDPKKISGDGWDLLPAESGPRAVNLSHCLGHWRREVCFLGRVKHDSKPAIPRSTQKRPRVPEVRCEPCHPISTGRLCSEGCTFPQPQAARHSQAPALRWRLHPGGLPAPPNLRDASRTASSPLPLSIRFGTPAKGRSSSPADPQHRLRAPPGRTVRLEPVTLSYLRHPYPVPHSRLGVIQEDDLRRAPGLCGVPRTTEFAPKP